MGKHINVASRSSMFFHHGCLSLVLAIGLAWAVPKTKANPPVSNSCPQGWIDVSTLEMGCIYFNTTTRMTWLDANAYCQRDEGARMIEIHSVEQLEFLEAQTAETAHSYWVVGSDVGREGSWFWQGTLRPVEEFLWGPGQPDGGYGEDCMTLSHTYWDTIHDYSCTNNYNVICQKYAQK